MRLYYKLGEGDITTCIQCKCVVKKQTLDPARDLVRVGQEALEKATSLESIGKSIKDTMFKY